MPRWECPGSELVGQGGERRRQAGARGHGAAQLPRRRRDQRDVAVEDGDGQDVGREGQRVDAQADAGHAQHSRRAGGGQLAVEGPAAVVQRAAEVPVVLAGGEQFLAELADH